MGEAQAQGQHKMPSPSTARMLLQDVSLRLADQHAVCNDLLACLNHIEQGVYTMGKQPHHQQRVVRAINSPVYLDSKQVLEQQQEFMLMMEKLKRSLNNLKRLHKDTAHLAYGLIDERSSVVDRFHDADRHLVLSTFEQIRSRHASTVEALADIVIALRRTYLGDNVMIDTLVDTFLRGRLGVQLLCDHYVALHQGKPHGGITLHCRLIDVADDAVAEATHICDAHFQNAPEVLVKVSQDAATTLIRPWVHHALVELLKNALASSLSSEKCPSIHLQLEECDDFISFFVIDQGAGVSDTDKAFRFASSSVGKRWDRLEEQQSYATVRSPLQSLGVGLPLSRMLLQHFHGNVTLSNNVGDLGGCTSAIHLNKDDNLLKRHEDDKPNDVL